MSEHPFGSGLVAVGVGIGSSALRWALRIAGCAVALLGAAAPAGAIQWASNGPTGGIVLSLAVDPSQPNVVYAGTNGGGVFKSTDGGFSWIAVNGGIAAPASLAITGLSVDPLSPGRVYASGQSGAQGGVFASSDGGASWTYIELGPTYDVASAGSPPAPNTLYAAGGSLRRSTDGGASWTVVSPNHGFRRLAVDPTTPTTIYGGASGSIWKSIDGGTTWDWIGVGLGSGVVKAIVVDPVTPDVVYAGLDGSGVYKSIDGGYEWQPVGPAAGGSALAVQALAMDPSDSATLYAAGFAAGSPGVYKTTDGGATWTGTSLERTAFALAAGAATVVAGTGAGAWVSTDAGGSWAESNAGLVNTAILSLAPAAEPRRVYAGAWNGKVFRSANGGATWQPTGSQPSDDPIAALAVDPTDPSVVYAGTLGTTGIFKSTDGGATWSPLSTGTLPPINGYSLAVDPTNPSVVYAGSFVSLYRSEAGGESWVPISLGLFGAVVSLALDPTAPDTLYAGTDALNGGGFPGIFKTTNAGADWEQINEGLPHVPNTAVQALALDPASGAVYAGLEKLGVYKTTNGGASWQPASSGLTNLDVTSLQVDPTLPETVYAATNGGGVFRSTDGGASWVALDAGLYNPHVAALAVPEPGRLLAASGGDGVFFVPACANEVDDDGDGLADHPADPGCASPLADLESPQCDDDLDNDGDGATDWDGGPASGAPDPQCTTPSRNREGSACGMGGEVVLLLWLLAGARRLLA